MVCLLLHDDECAVCCRLYTPRVHCCNQDNKCLVCQLLYGVLFQESRLWVISEGRDKRPIWYLLVLERFAAVCDAVRINISTSQSKAMVHLCKRCPVPSKSGLRIFPKWTISCIYADLPRKQGVIVKLNTT